MTNITKREKTLSKFKTKNKDRFCLLHEKIETKKHQKNSLKNLEQKTKDKEGNSKTKAIF